jgi:hypothetical protein
MKRYLSLALCLVVVATWSGMVWATDGTAGAVARDYSGYQIAEPSVAGVLHGGAATGLSKAALDTVFLYGGPGSLNGKFQTSTLQPDRQGWAGVDLTGLAPHWHIDAFNAANMAARPAYWTGSYTVPATNHAIWAGLLAGPAGFVTTGYGNNWHDQLDHSFTVSNTADSTVISWDLQFNHDSEDGYDFFHVQWDSAGSMINLADYTGFNAGGVAVDFHGDITYHSGDYVGAGHDQVHIRGRFDSDGAASDEDGLNATGDGAVQLDNIQVNGTNGVGLSQATFEGGSLGGWALVQHDFAGDFSKVYGRVEDTDPCRDNITPQMTFIDDNTAPNNDPAHRTTGGSTSPTNTYGVPGGWVVNYTGGLTLGESPCSNEVWSPELNWDLPGTADDLVDGGAFIRYGVWQHLPLNNGIFWVWHVRSFPAATGGWTGMKDRNFVYYGGGVALYTNVQNEIRDLLVSSPTKVQFALGMTDLADLFNFPGNDASISPTFDNAGFAKYAGVGPGEVTREIDLFNDGFPTTGAISCTSASDNDLAIRLDMARDIRASSQPRNVPGDSIICDFVARKPGSSVVASSIHMEFLLVANPCFDAERAGGIAALPGIVHEPLASTNRWRGSVTGQQSRTASGSAVANRYFFDLPDGPVTLAAYESAEAALFFPGDQIRYYLTASTINPAETSTLPADTSGFGSGTGYNRVFTVYGLPTLTCGATDTSPCTQPSILFWNDQPDRGGNDEWGQAFGQNGLVLHQQYDTYRTNGPSSLVSDGLGSAGAHGANSGQLAGYNTLFYDAANLASGLISDGSSTGTNDKGNDVAALTGWFAQAGNRYAAYWGDNIANGLGGGGVTYRSNVMGVTLRGDNVRPRIGNQTAPEIGPTGAVAGFSQHFIAFGGCLSINLFDDIVPGAATAVSSHQFLPGPYATTPSACVYNARQDTIAGTGYDRVNMTFPYGFLFVQDVFPKTGGRSARAGLTREALTRFGHSGDLDQGVVATDPIASRRLVVDQNRPNPFNPVTNINFAAPARGHVSVKIYNVRGELVTKLLDGIVEAGQQSVTWNGTDTHGRSVASGVYLYEVSGFDQSVIKKMALVK